MGLPEPSAESQGLFTEGLLTPLPTPVSMDTAVATRNANVMIFFIETFLLVGGSLAMKARPTGRGG
jgi:hypothetical protein